MEIKKRYYKFKRNNRNTGNIQFSLRTDFYDNSLDYYQKLFAEAQKDFPNLKPEDVKCRVYDGDTYKGLRGIDFNFPAPNKGSVKTVNIPKGYENNHIIIPAV